jgi:hypothetical protein
MATLDQRSKNVLDEARMVVLMVQVLVVIDVRTGVERDSLIVLKITSARQSANPR